MPFRRGQVTEVKEVFDQVKENFRPGQFNRELLFLFKLDDESWTIFLRKDGCEVKENDDPQFADCTVEMSKEIFLGSFNGTYKPTMMDLFSGKIKVDRPEMLFAFKDLFGAF